MASAIPPSRTRRRRFAVLPLTQVAGVVTDADAGNATVRALGVPVIQAT
ncbi:hypothetical protein ACWEPN_04090 [Nonomuraea wenchangensis]